MSILREQLESGQFVVTAEIAPPKGVDCAPALETARALRGVCAVNVTDNQGANVRMSPLAMAALLRREGIEPVLQLTCRDRNRLALQADLLGAAALGIENLLLLTGDHVSGGDHGGGKAVFDLDSSQLLEVAGELMDGRDMAGNELSGFPRFFCGAAVAPAAQPFELMFHRFSQKISAGARFFQTQAVFEPAALERFMAAAHLLHTPVICGVLLLKNASLGRFLNKKVPGVQVPAHLIERLENAAHPLDEGVAIARDCVAQARELCAGVHLMTLGCEDLIPEIMQ